MKMKNTVISLTIAVTQSTWIRPALMTLALAVACPRSDRLPTAPLNHPSTTKQTQHSKMKGTVMKTKHNILSKISLSSGLAVMKNRVPIITTCLIGAGLLAVATFMSVEQKTLAAEPPADPAHAAHVAAGAMPPDAAMGDAALSQQLSQLQAKVAQLEATLAGNAPRRPVAAAPAAGAMPRMAARPALMAGKKRGAPGATTTVAGMGGMAGGASPPGVDAAMLARMDKMIGMMDRMVGMMDRMTGGTGGGTAAGGAPMPSAGMMDDDQMEMGSMGGGAMQPGQAAPAAGGMSGMGGGASPPGDEMGMKMDKMMGMMEKMMGGGAMQPGQAAPPMGGDM